MLKDLKPDFGLRIISTIVKSKISPEEAALFILLKNDKKYFKDIIKSYDYSIKTALKKMSIKRYSPKSRKKYDLFLKFYRKAKKDLKKSRKIKDETIKIIS